MGDLHAVAIIPSPNLQELEKIHAEALGKGITPRSLVVINPGNPTGNTLPLENMQAALRRVAMETMHFCECSTRVTHFPACACWFTGCCKVLQ